MSNLQVQNALGIVLVDIDDLISLPDQQAAEALNLRLGAFEYLERLYKGSFSERTRIVRNFETRSLWKYLIDPDTGYAFPNMTAWLSCSSFLGCRRTNFEALRMGKMLADVPDDKLVDIPKENMNMLAHLSTAVRTDPVIIEAARKQEPSDFEGFVEKNYPHQHIERRAPWTIRPGRSERKVIDKWVERAIRDGIAGSTTEAIVRACEIADYQADLEEELRTKPVPERRV
jgi:hypothetical protein